MKKNLSDLEGLILALKEMLDAYGNLKVEATQRGTSYSLKILDVWLTNDNSPGGDPNGVIQLAIEES